VEEARYVLHVFCNDWKIEKEIGKRMDEINMILHNICTDDCNDNTTSHYLIERHSHHWRMS